MIVITSIELDAEGAIHIDENPAESDFGKVTRRQNRVATLDGGSVLQDRGYSNTDLTFAITAKKYTDDFSRLRDMIQTQSEVRLSCRVGTFIGTLSGLVEADVSFDFLVTANDS